MLPEALVAFVTAKTDLGGSNGQFESTKRLSQVGGQPWNLDLKRAFPIRFTVLRN
jgi:hypothetical protein